MAISPINNVNNNIRNLSFGENKEKPDTKSKSQISTQTKVIVGIGLAALSAVGIYIATRGKVKNEPNIDINENIKNVIKSYKERYKEVFFRYNPKITTLKNGKTKIEFLGRETEKHLLICNRNGEFEKRIVFNKNNNTNTEWYDIYINFENGEKDKIKTFISKKTTADYEGINVDSHEIKVKEYKSGKEIDSKQIAISKNDKFAYISNWHENEFIEQPIVKTTTIAFNNGKPQLVYQTIKKNKGNWRKFVFEPKKDSIKKEVTKSPFITSNELLSVMVSNKQ